MEVDTWPEATFRFFFLFLFLAIGEHSSICGLLACETGDYQIDDPSSWLMFRTSCMIFPSSFEFTKTCCCSAIPITMSRARMRDIEFFFLQLQFPRIAVPPVLSLGS